VAVTCLSPNSTKEAVFQPADSISAQCLSAASIALITSGVNKEVPALALAALSALMCESQQSPLIPDV
jgi:hypothetical protein